MGIALVSSFFLSQAVVGFSRITTTKGSVTSNVIVLCPVYKGVLFKVNDFIVYRLCFTTTAGNGT